MQCVLMTIYMLLIKPFTSNFDNYLECFNEYCILGICYHLFIFTDFVPSDVLQYNGGWSVIVLTLLNLLSNSIIILCILGKQLKVYIKRYCKIR